MSFFGKILEKLGMKKDEPEPVDAKPQGTPIPGKPPAKTTTASSSKPAAQAQKPAGAARPAASGPARPVAVPPSKPAAPAPMSEVDVVKKLEQLSAGKGLNWKVSIVDLLKLLDLDSSYEARVELAKELSCPPELMNDSAKMNTWLHKEVLRQIAANGGNIPKELLD